MASEEGFDLAAASLRADRDDLPAFIESLAVKLRDALPERARVERRRSGLFWGEETVRRIEVTMSDWSYVLELEHGEPKGRRQKSVRGVAIKGEDLDLDEWTTALVHEIAAEAERSEGARVALERLLG
jgi:hypothetical protein